LSARRRSHPADVTARRAAARRWTWRSSPIR